MKNINDVCDYVIFRLTKEGGSSLSHLKLQKLLYYIQSWFLAYEGKALFDGKFQAWIHGPVNRNIYDRFKDSKYMYSSIRMSDVLSEERPLEVLTDEECNLINIVLEAYAKYSDVQLETMTHAEKPWLEARRSYQAFERCEIEIDERTMQLYYGERIQKNK